MFNFYETFKPSHPPDRHNKGTKYTFHWECQPIKGPIVIVIVINLHESSLETINSSQHSSVLTAIWNEPPPPLVLGLPLTKAVKGLSHAEVDT